MYKVDAKKIKKQLTIDNILHLMEKIGAVIFKEKNNEIMYYPICHDKDFLAHHPKLSLFKDSGKFHCYSNCGSMDIVEVIRQTWITQNKSFAFEDILNYIIKVCNLDLETVKRKTQQKLYDNWQQDIEKYVRFKSTGTTEKIYDNKILNYLENVYHEDFIDDNISIETMQKFNLKYYDFMSQVVIPVYNINNQLIGMHSRNFIPELVEMGYKYMPTNVNGTEYKFSTGNILYGLNFNKENIQQTREITLCEAPKSVLQADSLMEHNNTVGMFGMFLQKTKRDMILDLGVERVNIALDKQYHQILEDDDEEIIETEEYKSWEDKVMKIANMLRGYVRVFVIYDDEDLLDYKDSPTDKGKEVWDKLYKNREELFIGNCNEN